MKEVITVDTGSSVKEAADVMNRFEIGCFIVTKNSKAIGILMELDRRAAQIDFGFFE